MFSVLEIKHRLAEVVDQFPPSIAPGQRAQIDRFAFDIAQVVQRRGTSVRIADIGGGWGTFILGCAALGMRATLVDDFRDSGFFDEAEFSAMKRLYDAFGVQTVSCDVVKDGLDLPGGALDVVTCFDSMEHWHGSPRRLFRSLRDILVPGGLFVLATPNCVNLRKRITVPLGRGKWSAMADWYETDVFRGHVREPDVDDLRYIARDIGLRGIEIFGRNWMGYWVESPFVRRFMPLIDAALRLHPPFCSDLYLIGSMPAD